MNNSKAAIVINMIIGKVQSIIGYAAVILFGLPLIMGAFKGVVSSYILALIFIAVGILLIFLGSKTKRRIKRFKKYVEFISIQHMTSIENLASATTQSIDFVKNDLQIMISKKFFANASLNLKTNEIIIGQHVNPNNAQIFQQQNIQIQYEPVSCPGCGALNNKQVGIQGNCEYCASILK